MKRPYHHGALSTALLEAAATILERDGIAGLSLRAIAREAGVSHAAPAHHFHDLAGLMSALAASGFVRLRAHIQAESEGVGQDPKTRLKALGRGYIGFARVCPGLFQLMFRSERLDWSNSALSSAAASAFALLGLSDAEAEKPFISQGFKGLAASTARWSFMHGVAMLLIDGRLEAMSDRVPGADIETLIEELLTCLVRQEARTLRA